MEVNPSSGFVLFNDHGEVTSITHALHGTRSSFDAGPAASFTADDLVSLFERALSFAVLTLFFRLLLHFGIPCEAALSEAR
jgi:hypothetical protein